MNRTSMKFNGALFAVGVLMLCIAPWHFLSADDPPAQPEPPVRLRKKARPPEEAVERKPEPKPEEAAKDKPDDAEAKPPQLRRPKTDEDEPDAPAEAESNQREILDRVAKNMRESQERLSKHDPGTGTQQKQRDAVADLDKLIEQQKQQQQQQASSSSSQNMRRQQRQRQTTRQQQQQEQQKQQQEQTSKNNANQQPGMSGRSQGSSKIADLYKDIWGHLPETMRQEMDAYSREQFMAKYNDLLKQYYSTLAEKGRRQGD